MSSGFLPLDVLGKIVEAEHAASSNLEKEICASWRRMFPVAERPWLELNQPQED